MGGSDSVLDGLGLTQDGARISYAQNGEDVRLWRALDDVQTGFYVEVGGWDPVQHSISRSFYLRGWSGLVIEPVPENCERFSDVRPRDLVVPVAASSEDGFVEFHSVPGTGLSTSSAAIAARHASSGLSPELVTLPGRRLAGILAEVSPPAIHFMTVDVEGAELDVLRGMDFVQNRPWILVVEATEPGRATPTSLEWEPLVLDAGYELVAFDGLNRYYVADEHSGLGPGLALSPNIFDGYRPAEWAVAVAEARATWIESREREQTLEALLHESRRQLAIAKDEASSASGAVQQRDSLQAALDAVVASRSWRITQPLRRVAGR